MTRPATILLLQARDPGDPAKTEEVRSFAAHSDLETSQVIPWDLLEGPPTLRQIRRYDALMVGGAGDYYVSKANLPHFDALLNCLREVSDVGFPTFASCFGFQCLVVALGGEIVFDGENTEVGTYPVTLNKSGRRDELFSSLPTVFNAQLGRKDRAVGPIAGTLSLAASEACPVQALRLPGKPIWASQFHPELDRMTNRGRFEMYLEGYASVMSPEEQQATLDSFRDSPEANSLLMRFLKLVLA